MKLFKVVISLSIAGTMNAATVTSRVDEGALAVEAPKASVVSDPEVEAKSEVKPAFAQLTDKGVLPDAKTLEALFATHGFGAYFLEKVRGKEVHRDFPNNLANKELTAVGVVVGLNLAFGDYKQAISDNPVVVITTSMLWNAALPKILEELGFTNTLIQEMKQKKLM